MYFCRKVLSVRKKKGLTIAEVAARFVVGVARDVMARMTGTREAVSTGLAP